MGISTLTLIYYCPNKTSYDRCSRSDNHVSDSCFEMYVYQNDTESVKYLSEQWATLKFNNIQDSEQADAEIILLMNGLDKNNWEDEFNIPEQDRSAYNTMYNTIQNLVEHRYAELMGRVRAQAEAKAAKQAAIDAAHRAELQKRQEEAERIQYELLKTKFEGCGKCWKCLDGKTDKLSGFPLTSMRMILCPTCGNKRCPKATDHTLTCTSSNEPGQPGSVY